MSEDLVFKTTYSQPVESTASAENATSWWEWVDRRIDAGLEALTESIGQVVAEERAWNERVYQKELEPLRRELAELRGQISTLVLLSGAKPADLAEAIESAKTPGPRGLQGPRGPRGERGHRGEAGPSIIGWALDRERFIALPLMSDGRPGPGLELRGLFEQYQRETNG
jgi:hypothetical protein